MLSAIVWTPKRHFLTSQRVFWDISREIPCTGCFSRLVREKNKNKKERPYISRISPGAPLRPIFTNFELRVRLVGVINCAKFYRSSVKGFGFYEWSKFDHSHWIAMSPLTLVDDLWLKAVILFPLQVNLWVFPVLFKMDSYAVISRLNSIHGDGLGWLATITTC